MIPTMKHLGRNLLCSIDTETTGLKPGENEIIQIAILPLDFELRPHTQYPPFVQLIKPQIEGQDCSDLPRHTKRVLREAIESGTDPYVAANMLEHWFDMLDLGGGKITPLAQNWPFDCGMIKFWLSNDHYESMFHHRYRDLMTACEYINDRCDTMNEPSTFTSWRLSAIAKKLKVDFDPSLMHEGLYDCQVTARCYRALLAMFLKNF